MMAVRARHHTQDPDPPLQAVTSELTRGSCAPPSVGRKMARCQRELSNLRRARVARDAALSEQRANGGTPCGYQYPHGVPYQ
jgi:hypothetical protein